jgi:topoisomerase IA-like protein
MEKYGPVLRYKTEDNKYAYKNIKKELNVTIQDIKKNTYNAEELIEEDLQHIGTYQEHEVYVKMGKYGAYVEWNDQKKSLKHIDKPMNEMTLEDAISVLKEEVQDKNVLRTLNTNLSIRKGKFGPYIYYKTPSCPKPQFFNLKKYKGKYFDDDATLLLEWIKDTYQVE